jgi:hypothetical protein
VTGAAIMVAKIAAGEVEYTRSSGLLRFTCETARRL